MGQASALARSVANKETYLRVRTEGRHDHASIIFGNSDTVTAIGVLFIAIGAFLSLVLSWRWRSFAYFLLYCYHLTAALVAWYYSLTHIADAQGYYASGDAFAEFGTGTAFVTWLTAQLKDGLDASYLDLHLVFHLFGYCGIVFLCRICGAALEGAAPQGSELAPDRKGRLLYHAVVFLPSLHFWTSAIGKDGLVFMGILCFVWGMARPQSRVAALLIGLSVCSVIRPHIAAMLAVSCGAAAVFSSDTPLLARLFLLTAVSVGFVLALPFLKEFVGLQDVSAPELSAYVEFRQDANFYGGSSVDIAQYSPPMQVFTFLFRPLFLDTREAMGLFVSCENLFLLCLFVLLSPGLIRVIRSRNQALFVRFNIAFALMATVTLATTIANMGLALRQKVMVLPSILIILLMSYRARVPETVLEDAGAQARA
jgi:hypothetical protein